MRLLLSFMAKKTAELQDKSALPCFTQLKIPKRSLGPGRRVTSYVGLIPQEKSSGGRQRFGRLTKQGNRLLRFLLVEAAQSASRCDPAQRGGLSISAGTPRRSPSDTARYLFIWVRKPL